MLAAHLFVFYYAVLSDLTPPDAVTAFAAANIAGSEMMATGLEAFRLGIAGFLIPFAFIYHPELLLNGSWPEILLTTSFAATSAIALAASVVGHIASPLTPVLRLVALSCSLLMVVDFPVAQLTGVAVFVALTIWSSRRGKRKEPVSISS